MQRVFTNDIFLNILSTMVAVLVVAIIYFIAVAALTKKTDDRKEKQRRRVRLFYLMAIFFIFVLARIWVEGFTQLLAVLGLVSAALVITNKEVIMNFSGWLIITWRGLFTEDDLIEIQQYKGYVGSIRVLYFSLREVDKNSHNVITGRLVRIPNGLVVYNPVVNFSPGHLLEQHFAVIFEKTSDIDIGQQLIKKATEKTLKSFYKDKKEFSKTFLQQRNKKIAAMIDLEPVITIKAKYGMPSGMEVSARYYCFAADQESIEQGIWRRLLKYLAKTEKVKLAV
jgi:small-conductance mechanosensitive channel